MELRHLQSFLAAARAGSFTRAAQSLGLTQAAISQHVAALEKDLGVRLFDRVKRTVALSDAGRRLEEYASQILALVEAAKHELGGGATRLSGTLRIATSTVPAEIVLPELLAAFQLRHPHVREAVTVTDTKTATRAVESGEADLGLVGEPPNSDRLQAIPIADDELVLVVAAQHPLAKRRRVRPDELRSLPLILREPGSGSRNCVLRALAAAGVTLRHLTVAMEMNSNDSIRAAVTRGMGAAFLSRAVVKRDLAEGLLVSLAVADVRAARELYLIRSIRPGPATRDAFFSFAENRRGGR